MDHTPAISKHDQCSAQSPGSGSLPFQAKSSATRQLTPDEQAKLAKDTKLVSEFKQMKLEKEAQRNWDIFYKRNTTKFFKDRHWTTREFSELCGEDLTDKLTVLEVGCGVGNFVFPLLEENPNIYFYACDFSPRAVQFVKEHASYFSGRCMAFQNDLTQDPLSDNIPPGSVNIVTMIFVLSAVHPEKMVESLKNIHNVLKDGGIVLIRDYGLYDHAMLRFAPGHKLAENSYVRQDGTRAYYFSKDMLCDLFGAAGFKTVECEYILRETVNRAEGLCVPRVFVQAKFMKACEDKPDKSKSTQISKTELPCDEKTDSKTSPSDSDSPHIPLSGTSPDEHISQADARQNTDNQPNNLQQVSNDNTSDCR